MKVEYSIMNHKTATVKGVRAIDAFDDQRFSLSTTAGNVVIWGKGLRMRRWEAEQGLFLLEGDIGGILRADWFEQLQRLEANAEEGQSDKSALSAWKSWFR